MDWIIANGDTDSLTFVKRDNSAFSKEELDNYLKDLNSLYENGLTWEDDGLYPSFIVLKAKNYIMYDGKKIKLKGSALKSSTLEPIIKKMINEMIDALVYDKQDKLVSIYHDYIKKACEINDIIPWSKKVTISTRTLTSERANETKIIDALNRSNVSFSEGDKIYVFFLENGELELTQNFNKQYDKDVFLEKLFKATARFKTILPINEMFINYSLKRNKRELDKLLLS